jgi:hypothetical protein
VLPSRAADRLPAGVELDLVLLGVRQRARAAGRALGLLALSATLAVAGVALAVVSVAALVAGVSLAAGIGAGASVGALVAAVLGVRTGMRRLAAALWPRRSLERLRLTYESHVLASRARARRRTLTR